MDPEAWDQQGTLYKRSAEISGMNTSALKRLKELEEGNRRLKQIYADLSLEHRVLKDIVEKRYQAGRAPRTGPIGHRRRILHFKLKG